MTPEKKKRVLRVLVLFCLFVILFLGLRLFFNPRVIDEQVPSPAGAAAGFQVRPVTDTLESPDTALTPPVVVRKHGQPGKTSPVAADSSLPVTPDSAAAGSRPGSAPPADTTPPYVYADPGPGLHPAAIQVRLLSDEPADIEYTLNSDTAFVPYTGPVPVSDSAVITFRARDRYNNVSLPVRREYLIRPPRRAALCPDGMAAVETDKGAFCVDRYEWPNKKGAEPLGYINWYMAYDSCRTINKRLCTASEWEAACAGRKDLAYPYGDAYEVRACNTESSGSAPSGAFVECRSFAGAYDMSGNLREWTDTKNAKNPRHYQVYGGFWDGRGASRCRETQYSFFPENRFISIGFRCCQTPAGQ